MARLHSNIGDMLERMTPSDVVESADAAGEELAPQPGPTTAADAVTEPAPEARAEPTAEATAEPAVEEAPAKTAKSPRKPRTSTPKKVKAADPAPEPEAESAEEEAPQAVVVPSTGYLSYERKEARLREDQYAELTLTSRRLNRAKGPGGERITENTLIRVAIDMLLAKKADLRGMDEAALRQSMGL